jgi:hypothetical protein
METISRNADSKSRRKKTKLDWAYFIEEIANQNECAEKITLVMDNLNTHKPDSLYEAFPLEKAKALWDRFEFVYTPKHGSWLNIAEIELNVLTGQCLNRRIDDIKVVRNEVTAWQKFRNNKMQKLIGNSQQRMLGSNYPDFIRHYKAGETLEVEEG